jgi:hypothetical protein
LPIAVNVLVGKFPETVGARQEFYAEVCAPVSLDQMPDKLAFLAINAMLALPDVLTAGAGNRLRGMFLFQGLPTNWTIFAPHIHTCLLPKERVCLAR